LLKTYPRRHFGDLPGLEFEFPTGMGMNRQLFCVKKELENGTNILNDYTMQMQTLINQKAIEAAEQRSFDSDFCNAVYSYTTDRVKKKVIFY